MALGWIYQVFSRCECEIMMCAATNQRFNDILIGAGFYFACDCLNLANHQDHTKRGIYGNMIPCVGDHCIGRRTNQENIFIHIYRWEEHLASKVVCDGLWVSCYLNDIFQTQYRMYCHLLTKQSWWMSLFLLWFRQYHYLLCEISDPNKTVIVILKGMHI